MKLRACILGLVVIGLFSASAPQAKAGSALLGDSGWMANWDPIWDDYLSLSVDVVTEDTVVIEKFVRFTEGGLFIDPAVIVFQQVSADAVDNILINDEQIVNDTPQAWNGFRMTIQAGTVDGMPLAAFDPETSRVGEPGGFSIDPFTTHSFSHDNKILTVGGGTIPNGPPPANVWLPGSGEGRLSIGIQAAPSRSGAFRAFALKEQPLVVIPLPAAAWMGLSSLGGLAACGLFRRTRRA